MPPLEITSIEVDEVKVTQPDIGKYDFSLIYEAGAVQETYVYAMKVHTNEGITGEFVGGDSPSFAQFHMFADYLIGKSPFERELIYNDVKRALRKFDRMGMGPIDIALWDLAGKYYGASISELLGGWRKTLPCYASTFAGDRGVGLNSPEAFADFAVQCKEMGYRGYKMHSWSDYDIDEDVATITAVRDKVGPEMDLMHDPGCRMETFAHALKLGWACDEANYLWLEDPYRDGGISVHGHRRLRSLIKTPLLLTEHVRGLEQHVNFIQGEATDIVRVDPEYDGGITGAVKIAHAAEGFGLDVEIHAPGPAQRQLMAAIRNTNYYENALVHPLTKSTGRSMDIFADDYRDGLDAIDANGHVPVPDGPGLGVQYDWDFLTRNRNGGRRYPGGSHV